MPRNPSRRWQGGDVEGTTRIDVTRGEALPVARASFDPGYSLETTLSDADTDVSHADLVQGYCTYGKVIGER
jgi:hypothetical protein